ncbi:2387_t:CDS:2 [Funneliformis geosporum]|uniref:19737_t:CDS:1 n=1 Tax=Funneliformis geosporum TaxID=1117311 RepID=A0A9W4SCF6_9GLOM|nr:19737_t:CDS:2 [Funneliformis geosporum]CAI2187185.1 2387_t:CDS:2 [Funneliformis geosporum]
MKTRSKKGSLGYINDVIDDSIKDSRDARTFLSDKLRLFVMGHADKRNHDHMEDSQDHKEPCESNSDDEY